MSVGTKNVTWLHGVQGVCSESASFDLPAAVLAASVQEVQTALEVALVRREESGPAQGREMSIVGAGKPHL